MVSYDRFICDSWLSPFSTEVYCTSERIHKHQAAIGLYVKFLNHCNTRGTSATNWLVKQRHTNVPIFKLPLYCWQNVEGKKWVWQRSVAYICKFPWQHFIFSLQLPALLEFNLTTVLGGLVSAESCTTPLTHGANWGTTVLGSLWRI